MNQPHQQQIPISVVIPTCNRKPGLLALLGNLDHSEYPLFEVIIVDSGDDRLVPDDYERFTNLKIHYMSSERSVSIQRNIGIRLAGGPLIFLCDDDIEVPPDYLQRLTDHLALHPEAGAVSGLVLQQEKGVWQASYPVRSASELLRKFIFQLSIWGEIDCPQNNLLIKKITAWYRRKGNHISLAGWPVITEFSGDYFISPIYGLGASLVKKEWLVHSPYEEVLDRNGIGDNYGVAIGFPVMGIHILTQASVNHHQAAANRLHHPLQYLRRVLALDYFIRTKKELQHIKRRWLIWSLTGNFLMALLARNGRMIHSTFTSIRIVTFGRNPYMTGAKNNQRIVEPTL